MEPHFYMYEVPGTLSGHLEMGPTVIYPVTEVEPSNNKGNLPTFIYSYPFRSYVMI